LIWVSFASEPEFAKNTLLIGPATIPSRRSAKRICGSFDIDENVW
jgi:hypothetical protein